MSFVKSAELENKIQNKMTPGYTRHKLKVNRVFFQLWGICFWSYHRNVTTANKPIGFHYTITKEMSQLQTSQSDFTTQLQKEMSQQQTSQRKYHNCRRAKANVTIADKPVGFHHTITKPAEATHASRRHASCISGLEHWRALCKSQINGLYSLRVMLQHNGRIRTLESLVQESNKWPVLTAGHAPA